MAFGEFIDRYLIEPLAPRMARKRAVERLALGLVRKYDGAGHGRRTAGWHRPSTSADQEVRSGLRGTRNAARELVRNSKLMAAAVRQVVVHSVGDGIAGRAHHPDAAFAPLVRAANEDWTAWCASRVDGRNDWFGVQRLAMRGMVEGGETLVVWSPDASGPNGRCRVLEGDHLDETKDDPRVGAGRQVQGVEFDADGFRSGYWILDHHPGDIGAITRRSQRFDARHVDHIYEELRAGQTRGVSWLAPMLMDARDLGDIADAVRMKRKLEACLALILEAPESGDPVGPFSELGDSGAAPGSPGAQAGPTAARASHPDTMRPGMIYRTRPGETAKTLAPTSAGDGVEFMRQEIQGMAASLAPYHLISGDVSRANYSSLRAANIGFWAMLDDWQQNILVPHLCEPAFRRRMHRLAVQTGDNRYLQLRVSWAMPVRRFTDPIKDAAGELIENRAGWKSYERSLNERGLSLEEHVEELARVQKLLHEKGLVLEVDPSRLTQSGIIQAAAAYLKTDSSADAD